MHLLREYQAGWVAYYEYLVGSTYATVEVTHQSLKIIIIVLLF